MKEHRRKKPGPQKVTRSEERQLDLYHKHLDELLDEALKGTFPASDPAAVTPRPPRRPVSAASRKRQPRDS